MKKRIAVGLLLPALAIVLSRWLIRSLASLFALIGALLRLDEDILSYGVQILDQLRRADIVSPWLSALLIGAIAGVLSGLFFRSRPKRSPLRICLLLLSLLPLTLLALWYTKINGIQVGALLSVLLPMLPHLL